MQHHSISSALVSLESFDRSCEAVVLDFALVFKQLAGGLVEEDRRTMKRCRERLLIEGIKSLLCEA